MFSLLKFVFIIFRGSWNIVNPNINPLRSAPPHIKYFASVLLGCFWSLAFGLYTAQFFFIGLNMIAHIGIISMGFATWYTFRHFRKTYGSAPYPLMRDPNFSPKCYEMTDSEKLAGAERADKLLAVQKIIPV